MGQGKTGVGGDGAVKGLDRAGVEGQRQIAALNVGVPRGGGGGGQGKVVAVCQHGGFLLADGVEKLPPSSAIDESLLISIGHFERPHRLRHNRPSRSQAPSSYRSRTGADPDPGHAALLATACVSSLSNEVLAGLGCAHGWSPTEPLVPAREVGGDGAPIILGEAKVGQAARASCGDLTEIEVALPRHLRAAHHLAFHDPAGRH